MSIRLHQITPSLAMDAPIAVCLPQYQSADGAVRVGLKIDIVVLPLPPPTLELFDMKSLMETSPPPRIIANEMPWAKACWPQALSASSLYRPWRQQPRWNPFKVSRPPSPRTWS